MLESLFLSLNFDDDEFDERKFFLKKFNFFLLLIDLSESAKLSFNKNSFGTPLIVINLTLKILPPSLNYLTKIT